MRGRDKHKALKKFKLKSLITVSIEFKKCDIFG